MSCNRQWQHCYATTAPPPPGDAAATNAEPARADVNPSSTTASAEAAPQPEATAAETATEGSPSIAIDDMADQLQQLEEQLSVERTHVRPVGWPHLNHAARNVRTRRQQGSSSMLAAAGSELCRASRHLQFNLRCCQANAEAAAA